MRKIYPSDLAELPPELRPTNPVSWDTETSGLWPDAGHRIATVSVAWILDDEQVPLWWEYLGGDGQHLWEDGIWTLRREITAGARSIEWAKGGWAQQHWILSMAWPFDQGYVGTGKAEDPTDRIVAHGREGLMEALDWTPDLPEADPNLSQLEWVALLQWLQDVGKAVGLTAHNAKFDVHMTNAGVRRWPDKVLGLDLNTRDLLPYVTWDTAIGADLWVSWRMGDFGKPNVQLKLNAAWLWGDGETDEKTTISKYLRKHKLPAGRWDLIPWDVIARYADQDARLTARYRKWQEVEQKRVRSAQGLNGAEKGWRAGYDPERFERRMDTMRMLTRVERRGVPFNSEMAREAIQELGGRIEVVEAVLAEHLGGKVTLPMAKHYWFGSGDKTGEKGRDVRGLGLPDYGRTKEGEPIVDVATIAKMHRDGYPLVEEWRTYKKLTDAKTRWYEGWGSRVGPDGRMRPGYRQNGTASARFSMEEIQLQAIPADYKVKGILEGIPSPRDLIGTAVPDGYGLWEMDLAQAELRVAAQMAGCRKMLEMIDAGEDLHGYTARELFGVSPDSDDWGMYRQVAKRGNFSLIFGVGGLTFQATLWKEAGVDWDIVKVKQFIAAWNALYPEFKRAIKIHEAKVMDRYRQFGIGWIEDKPTGERRHFTKWDVEYFNPDTGRTEVGAHKAFNQRVQPALAHYGIDRWLAEDRYLVSRYEGTEHAEVGAGLVLMVHDSSVLLLPDEDAEQVTSDLREMGRELWRDRFPGLPGDLDVSPWSGHA